MSNEHTTLSIFEKLNFDDYVHYRFCDCEEYPLFCVEKVGYYDKKQGRWENDYRKASHDVWKMLYGPKGYLVLVPWQDLNCYKELR
jgi:hypothetical protein